MRGGVALKRIAATGIEHRDALFGYSAQATGKRVEQVFGIGWTMPQNQRRGNDEDQALRNPENGEYLEEKPAHGSVRARRPSSVDEKLIAFSADGLDLIVTAARLAQLSSKPTHMHVKTSIKRAELPAEYFFRKRFSFEHSSRRPHQRFEQSKFHVSQIHVFSSLEHAASRRI
jgi:hypothetical protein